MEDEVMTTTEATETTDSFLDGWEDDGAAVSESADQPEEQTAGDGGEAEQTAENPGSAGGQAEAETTAPAAEGAAETPVQQQEQTPPADAPKQWTLRHMDETRTVGEAEMVTLAQKGMDYDRIRGKYDESKPVMELFGSFAKQAGMSIPDYVAFIRTQAKQATGMSEAEARRAVDLEDREAAVAVKEAAEEQRQIAATQAAEARSNTEARRRADILEFQQTFPDVAKDPKSIPQEVWADVRNGVSLVAAYSKYALAQARLAQQTAEQKAAASAQNQKNAARSSGSMRSAGENNKASDPFLDGWNS